MSDELPALEASKVAQALFAAHAPAHARDIIRCLAASYLVWLGDQHGREAVDALMLNEVESRWLRRTEKKPPRLVVSNTAELVHRELPTAS